MANILDILTKTIQDVQRKNEKDPNVATADPSVFDLLRREANKIDSKIQNKQAQKGKNPKSIFDMIQDGIEGVRKQNKKDSNVPTADRSVYEQILNKVQKKSQKQASSGLRKVVEDYRLEIGALPQNAINQIQQQYQNDLQKFNHQYANAINNLIHQQGRQRK